MHTLSRKSWAHTHCTTSVWGSNTFVIVGKMGVVVEWLGVGVIVCYSFCCFSSITFFLDHFPLLHLEVKNLIKCCYSLFFFQLSVFSLS